MTIVVPSRNKIRNQLVSYLASLTPSIDPAIDTDIGARIEATVDALMGLYYEARYIQYDIWPETASPEGLELHASTRLGTSPRLAPAGASGTDALRVTGLEGDGVTSGLTLAHEDGTRYELTESGTIPAGLTVDVSIQAISTGIITNKEIGDQLSFESPPTGIETLAEIVIDLSGGRDQETDAELLARVLHAIQNPPAGGRAGDYWQWGMSIGGVLGSWVYCPHSGDSNARRGLGTVDTAITAAGTGATREPSDTLVQEVQDYIDEQRPATADFLALKPTITTQAFHLFITPDVGYEWDWTGSGVNDSEPVDSYDSGTLTITWNVVSLPSDVIVGARLMCKGEVKTITAVAGLTTTVDSAFETDPVNGDKIYPAGALSQPIKDQVILYCDTLGPARGTAADPEQIWDDTIRISKIHDFANNVAGVKDCQVNTPSTNVVPTDPAPPSTPELLVYGEITISPP